MLELTMGGQCMSGEDSVRLFETVPEMIPEEARTEEFCDEYEYALNRLRYLVRQGVPTKPNVYQGRFTSFSCGQCGFAIDKATEKYCRNCGRKIDWSGF